MLEAISDIAVLLVYITGFAFAGCLGFTVIAVFSRLVRALSYQQRTGCNRRTAYKKFHIY